MSGGALIREWLEGIGLAEHAEAFEREQVDVDALPHLTEAHLKDLGLPLGHRVKILAAVKAQTDAPPRGLAPLVPHTPQAYTPVHLAEKILASRTALEGERKLVTVLFCDIADSTGLAVQAGAEAMHEILNRFFHLVMAEVHRYEGTVNQFLGDGLMALFGAPVAHEDHARRAVLAALGVRQAIEARQGRLGLPIDATLRVRIGVHTGPVVVGSIGDNLRMDYTAIGDTTNLAARLQQAAEPGQVLVSDATARLVEGYVNLQALAPLRVKGKDEPVRACEVTATGQRRSRLEQERLLSPYVGREREAGVLRAALDETLAGHGQVVSIVGEPGVGKSRVLYEFRQTLAERGVAYLEGWCQSFGQSIPYLPLQDVARSVCGIVASDGAARIAQSVEQSLAWLSLSATEDAPYLLRLLSVEECSAALTGLTPEAIQAHTLEVLIRLIFAHAHGAPLVLGIEDLHWIDKGSEAFLAQLVESIAGAPILVLTTTRPGYSPPWLTKSYATQVALRVLSTEASRRIVQATAQRSGVAGMTTEAVLQRAEGNPLFLEELTLALEGQGGMAATLPDTIQGVLAARIDRLPEETKRALQTAAVLGREFPLRLLAEIAQDAGLETRLASLKQLEFLFERLAGEGPVYTFKHVLTQEVAYEGLLSGRRQSLHGAAGRAIERLYPERLEEHCEVLAHHFSRSADKEKALDYLELANAKAAGANAVVAARACFEEAMRLLAAMPDDLAHRRRRVALLVRQVHVFVLTNGISEYSQYLDACEAAAQALGDDALLGHFYACRGHILFMFGRARKAVEMLRSAAQMCERAGNFHGAAHAYAHLQWALLQRGEYEEILSVEPTSLRALAHAPDMRLRVYALIGSACGCAMLGKWELGLEKCRAALEEAERARDASLISFSYTFGLSNVYRSQGAGQKAIDSGERALEFAQTPAERQWAQIYHAWALSLQDPSRAAAVLAPIVSFYRSAGLDWLEVFSSCYLGETYLLAGRLTEAREVLERTLEMGERLGVNWCAAPAERLLGEVLLAEGTPPALERARHHLERAIASLEQSKAENALALARAGLGRLQARLGRRQQARECLMQAQASLERLGTWIEPERIRAELAALDA